MSPDPSEPTRRAVRLRALDSDVGTFRGQVVYSQSDYALDFRPSSPAEVERMRGARGSGSLTIDTLQVEVSVEHSRLLYVWGFWPMRSWRPAPHLAPVVDRRASVVVHGADLETGVGIAIDRERRWIAEYDSSSGWLWSHAPDASATAPLVELADDSLAEIRDGALMAIWLRPSILT